jgi:serine/threonine protein kinase
VGRRRAGTSYPHLCSQSEGKLNIVMEFASRGSVEGAIQERQKAEIRAPFAELTVISWLRQLGGALQHMHSKQILHRDLKVDKLEAAALVLERAVPCVRGCSSVR